jgi:hypothetical protein
MNRSEATVTLPVNVSGYQRADANPVSSPLGRTMRNLESNNWSESGLNG